MRKKIDFLNRLFELTKCRVELLEFLKQERIINDDKMQAILVEHQNTHANAVLNVLNDANKSEALQLVSWEWTVLPKEFLRLLLVTEKTQKEFTYSL